MKTLVLGLGNPIITDDAVGLEVVRQIKVERPDLDVDEACSGVVDLLDYVNGYDRLILVDAIKTERGQPGTLYKMDLDDMKPTSVQAISHGLDIATAFKLGRSLGYVMPHLVSIYAIEVKDHTSFGEGCSIEVTDRVPSIAREIIYSEMV